jgi:peptide/nickel transport system permease protein
MFAYLVRRLLQAVLVTFLVVWFVFSLSYLQPDGAEAPAYTICKEHQTPTCLHHYILSLGLAHPYFFRLWSYLEGVVVHFNLGFSFYQNQSVVSLLGIYIPRTVWLALISLVLATIIAVPLGIIQAWRRNSRFDYAATGASFVLYAIPAFVLGFLLQYVFAYGHPWGFLQAEPPSNVNAWAIFEDPFAFLLPIVTLTALTVAGLSRFMRAQVLDVLVQDYIRLAKAKGCSSRGLLLRHTLRNAMGPIVVILGLSVPILLSGALIVEDLFNYEGLGYETINASNNGDIYTVLGITIIVTIATVLGNLLADIGLAVLNPRVRIEGATR